MRLFLRNAFALVMLAMAAFIAAPVAARRGGFLSTSGSFQLSSGGGRRGMGAS